MASVDIGIDLGTATVLVYEKTRGIILHEPSVVAVNLKTDKVVCVGNEAAAMIGKTHASLQAVHPLEDGVISNYKLTEVMIKHFLKKACSDLMIKPRVAVCIPSQITPVEAQAVVDAAVVAGARNVYLIEEPVAAAIGAGVELDKPVGNIILDIGGGTSDIAVLSMNGIVCKNSLKMAGTKMNQAIARFIRSEYNLLVGEPMAEYAKIMVGSADQYAVNATCEIKGRHLMTGLPSKMTISREALYPVILECVDQIRDAVRHVLERTPPELISDTYENGMIMTGGGAMLHGLDAYLSRKLKMVVRLAENPVESVAIGAGKSFQYAGKLLDGFTASSIHKH